MRLQKFVKELEPAEWDVLMGLRGPDDASTAQKAITVGYLRWLLTQREWNLVDNGPVYCYMSVSYDKLQHHGAPDLSNLPLHFGEHIFTAYGALRHLALNENDSVLAKACEDHIERLIAYGLRGSYYATCWFEK